VQSTTYKAPHYAIFLTFYRLLGYLTTLFQIQRLYSVKRDGKMTMGGQDGCCLFQGTILAIALRDRENISQDS
jgi:hypothetical protein